MTDFPFPPDPLPSDPAAMAELLRQFAEWQNIPQEARALVCAKPWQAISRFRPEQLATGP